MNSSAHHPLFRWELTGLPLLALLAALAYLPLVHAESELAVLVKGVTIGALALAAALAARDRDGFLLAGVMAASCAGDVLLELPDWFMIGAGAFALGHALAITLYLRHRAVPVSRRRARAAFLLIALGLVLPSVLVPDNWGLALYALMLTGMCAAAAVSTLPAIVPSGAVLFLLSDVLIGVRMLPAATGAKPQLAAAIWWLYVAGQALIFIGVRRFIRSRLQG